MATWTCERCAAEGRRTRPSARILRQPATGRVLCEDHLADERTRPTATPGTAAIEAQGLAKSYGTAVAVDGVTFAVPRGGVTGFVGPNGAGKTTTIRMLLGLVRPTAGTARVLGHPIQDPKRYLARVGALIEAPAFYPNLSARRNLRALAILGGHDPRRADDLLGLVGLADRAGDRYRSYSLGMKQRLGIAAALLPDPELVILDEPTNGLDPAGIREVRQFLRGLAREGKTIFVSSHLLSEIQRMCDRILVMRRGALLFDGPVDRLLGGQRGVVAIPQDPSQLTRLASVYGQAGHPARASESALIVDAPYDQAAALNRMAMDAGILLRELRAQPQDLEETVLELTSRGTP